MVAEPKPHQTGRKRQNMTKTGNDWDYYYDSYYASTAFPPRLAPPLKRQRLMQPTRSQQPKQQKPQPIINNTSVPDLSQLKVYSNPDILICGNCREIYTDLGELLEHKRNYCKVRFTCKCHSINDALPKDSTTALLCVLCKDSFPSAWELMVHAQAAHMINIYELGSRSQSLRTTQSPLRSPNQAITETTQSHHDSQTNKTLDGDDRGDDDDLDGHELIPSPDSGKSTDNEGLQSPIKIATDINESDHEDCDELMDLENNTRAGIIHALSNDSSLECNIPESPRRTEDSMIPMTNGGSLTAQD